MNYVYNIIFMIFFIVIILKLKWNLLFIQGIKKINMLIEKIVLQ